MPFVLRDATLADVEAVARVHVASWQTTYRGLLSDEGLDALEPASRAARRRERMTKPGAINLVATDAGGEVVGFCDAGPDRRDRAGGEIYAIYLLERVKRHGLGRRLLARTLGVMRERALVPISVVVLEDNLPARRFYEAMGAVPGEQVEATIFGRPCLERVYHWR